jgi:hypothetical protein
MKNQFLSKMTDNQEQSLWNLFLGINGTNGATWN